MSRRYSLLMALVVDIIRQSWERWPQLKEVDWMVEIHLQWFDDWVAYRADLSVADVDRQARILREQWAALDAQAQLPIASEIADGETPLGGAMQLSHPVLGQMDPLGQEPENPVPDNGITDL